MSEYSGELIHIWTMQGHTKSYVKIWSTSFSYPPDDIIAVPIDTISSAEERGEKTEARHFKNSSVRNLENGHYRYLALGVVRAWFQACMLQFGATLTGPCARSAVQTSSELQQPYRLRLTVPPELIHNGGYLFVLKYRYVS